MEKNFDFKRIGKRMPYTAPEGFLDDIETNVLDSLKNEIAHVKPKKTYRIWYSITAVLVAASVALLLVINFSSNNRKCGDFGKFEQAFSKLSSTDQNYLLDVYKNDLFINN